MYLVSGGGGVGNGSGGGGGVGNGSGGVGGVGNAEAEDKTKANTANGHCGYLLSLKNKSLLARMPFALLSLSGVALG